MVKTIEMVGSSIWIMGSGWGFSASLTVSPMVMPSTPVMARTSPGWASVSSTRFRPSKEYILVMRVRWICPPSLQMETSSPRRKVPWKTRPMAMRPR